jgi:hypothetical protein
MARAVWLLVISLSVTSCVTALKVEPVSPQYRQVTLKYFVENHGADWRRLDKIIESELQDIGFTVSSGYKNDRPDQYDILVTYDDQWQWAIVEYLIHMRIDLRSPKTNVLFSTGSSYQSSLARKHERLIIQDILNGMFPK